MTLFFDIVLGAGLAAAIGIRPFLPVLLAGGLAAANLRLDFGHTPFGFLEATVFVAAMAFVAAFAFALERRYGSARFEAGPLGAALAGISLGLGALEFAGALADDHFTWWPGLIGGLACAGLGQAAARGLFARVRGRLDAEARAALPIYAEGVALLAAGLVLLFPPLAIVVLALLAWLLAGARRRGQEKYAGLRILR